LKRYSAILLITITLLGLMHIVSGAFAIDAFSDSKIGANLARAIEADPTGEHRVMILFKESPDVVLAESYGAKIEYVYDIVPALACKMTGTAIKQLSGEPSVVKIELDSEVQALDKPLKKGNEGNGGVNGRVNGGGEDTWNIEKIGAPAAWEMGYTGQYWSDGTPHIQVAILDSGIDYHHPDLVPNVADYNGDGIIDGWDYVNKDKDPMDDSGHGTHVAGIVAAVKDNMGVVGVAPATHLYALKVLDHQDRGYWSWVIAALQWVLNGPDGLANTYDDPEVALMSFGGNSAPDTLRIAAENAYNNRIILVAAAGDDYDGVNYPAAFNTVIALAASDSRNKVPRWSSGGPEVELAAPGVDVKSTYYDPTTGKHIYTTMSGTSMAAPHIAGTVALMLSKNPSFTQAYYLGDGHTLINYIRSTLHNTAKDLAPKNRDSNSGYGLVRAGEACIQF